MTMERMPNRPKLKKREQTLKRVWPIYRVNMCGQSPMRRVTTLHDRPNQNRRRQMQRNGERQLTSKCRAVAVKRWLSTRKVSRLDTPPCIVLRHAVAVRSMLPGSRASSGGRGRALSAGNRWDACMQSVSQSVSHQSGCDLADRGSG